MSSICQKDYNPACFLNGWICQSEYIAAALFDIIINPHHILAETNSIGFQFSHIGPCLFVKYFQFPAIIEKTDDPKRLARY
jgi:hypothetical protein